MYIASHCGDSTDLWYVYTQYCVFHLYSEAVYITTYNTILCVMYWLIAAILWLVSDVKIIQTCCEGPQQKKASICMYKKQTTADTGVPIQHSSTVHRGTLSAIYVHPSVPSYVDLARTAWHLHQGRWAAAVIAGVKCTVEQVLLIPFALQVRDLYWCALGRVAKPGRTGKDNEVSYTMQLFHYSWRLANSIKSNSTLRTWYYVPWYSLIVICMQGAVPYPSQVMS